MKPEDARTKWCPFSRVMYRDLEQVGVYPPPPPGLTTINRSSWGEFPSGTTCVGNRCMAWRNVLNDPNDGHCGLAGFQPHGG